MMTDGTNLERLTTDAVYNSFFPDISADGTRIAFTSESDVVGQNADHNSEVFLYEPGAVTPMRQLTQTTYGRSTKVRLSRDGAYAYCVAFVAGGFPGTRGSERIPGSGGCAP